MLNIQVVSFVKYFIFPFVFLVLYSIIFAPFKDNADEITLERVLKTVFILVLLLNLLVLLFGEAINVITN